MTDTPPGMVAVEQRFDHEFFDAVRSRRRSLGYTEIEELVELFPQPRSAKGEGTISVRVTAALAESDRKEADPGLLERVSEWLSPDWTDDDREAFRSTVTRCAEMAAVAADVDGLLSDDVAYLERDIADEVRSEWDGPSITVESVSVESIALSPFVASEFLIGTRGMSFNDAVEFPDGYSKDGVILPPDPGEDVAKLHPYIMPPLSFREDETDPEIVDGFHPDRAGRRDLRRLSEMGVDTDTATETDLLGNVYLFLPEDHPAFDAIEAESRRQEKVRKLRILRDSIDGAHSAALDGVQLGELSRERVSDLYRRVEDELSDEQRAEWFEARANWRASQ